MKKLLSILLAAVMLLSMLPLNVMAADKPVVKLVSFMRGDVADLRSSELLEVQIEGYDGNPRELTYKWTSTLGTYLYIYNSHNMYGINNTYGEMEIYNTNKNVNRSKNVEEDRAGDMTLTATGFLWAAVYGAYSKSSELRGSVSVEVFDKNGKSLGSDSFSSFKAHNLDLDLDNVVIGLFEGEEVNALDLLGRSGVVHITCTQSSVKKAEITSGRDKISVTTRSGDYYVKGVSAGEAKLNINISKKTCKFHYNTSGSASPLVYVFKNPTTSTTTTTLTLDKNSIDERCEYFIEGNKGQKQPDGSIIFTGLNPNTEYTVEVRAQYNDGDETKYVYSFVNDTTKPAYKATVRTYLDNYLIDYSSIFGENTSLYIREIDSINSYIELAKSATGTYESVAYNGSFYLWRYDNSDYVKASNYEIIVENANAELNLHHYSITYDTNGGAFKSGEEITTEIYPAMSAVDATEYIPVRDGYIFMGWEYNGKIISSGKQITSAISAPATLKAKWEKAVNVTINVTIDHKTVDGFDPNSSRTELDVAFLEMTKDSPAFVETGDKLFFRENGVTDENGSKKAYDYSVDNNVSTYTATDYTYAGLLESSTFGVAVSKSGYDVGEITKIQDKMGNWIINIPLTYNPDDFDFNFTVKMADNVPTELYPNAVIVKVAYWNTEANEWKIISQQESVGTVIRPGVRVDIDSVTGEGSGSYPVWKYDGDSAPYGYRAIVTGFIYNDSTITVPTENKTVDSDNSVLVTYADDIYTATMNKIPDGKNFGSMLNGAYYNSTTESQQGTVYGVITLENFDITFDANGGLITGADIYIEEDKYYVPDTSSYIPVFGEHTFCGWYKDADFTEPAVSGELLTEDITLYAKWDQILSGNVRVAGSYMQNGSVVDVWSVDRAESAVVALQEITDNGVYNVARQTVSITWAKSVMIYGVSEEYKFTGLDPAKNYRIEVLTLNYGTTYQNSTTAFVNDDNYADDYNATDFEAVYTSDSKWKTFVNAYLSFEPASYFQPVAVDATLIGEGLRPEDTLVQIWYKETGSANEYQIISQHTVDPYGIEIGINKDGIDDGDYGYTVWNSVYNGNLYDYQAHLENIEGDDVSSWPVTVVYGAPSRYSPINNAPTNILQVKLIPNRYDIVYNENYNNDGADVISFGTHVWSYDTVIDYTPEREGYVFSGWYANSDCTGEAVTVIDKTVAENTNLFAKWDKRTDLELTVKYVDKMDNTVLATDIKTAQIFGDNVTAASHIKEINGYSYDSASAEIVTIGNGLNEITLYYVKNSYSYTVNYREVSTGNIIAPAKHGTALFKDNITESAIDIDGYILSGNETKSITIDTENNVITFYYIKRADLQLKVKFVDKENNKLLHSEIMTSLSFGNVVNASSLEKNFKGYSYDGASAESLTIGTGINEITLYYVKNTYSYTVNYLEATTNNIIAPAKYGTATYKDVVSENAINVDGYVLSDNESKSITVDTENNVITFYYIKRADLQLNVKHVDKDTNVTLFAETKNGQIFGNEITVISLIKDINGYSYDSASADSIIIDNSSNEIVLYYVKNTYKYTVNYIDEDSGNFLAPSHTAAAAFGSTVTETAIAFSDYVLTSDKVMSITIDAGSNTINFYYSTDIIGGGNSGNNSDGTPDKYQKKVIFRVVNGTWSDGSSADKIEYLTLMLNDKYSIDGTADLIVPTGMKPSEGFSKGSWDVHPPVFVRGTDAEVYTYRFIESVPGDPETPELPETPVTPDVDVPGEGLGIHVVFGKTDGIGWYRVSKDGGQTFDIVFGNSTYEVEIGTELIIQVGDLTGDSFRFYVNGNAVEPDENGNLVVTVNGYMLIGALGYSVTVPDADESLSFIEKIIKAIKDFFNMIISWFN